MLWFGPEAGAQPRIDRHALVTRHDVVLNRFDPSNPLSVGNGSFCFTVDATGLQTFPEDCVRGVPLGTLSDWGWHRNPNPMGWSLAHYPFKLFPDENGRMVPYADVPRNQSSPASEWLRANPSRMDLGVVGLWLRHADGSTVAPGDITGIHQVLDLWNGCIASRFFLDGQPVDVETVADPDRDGMAVRIRSSLLESHRLGLRIRFPFPTGEPQTMVWDHPSGQVTLCTQLNSNQARFTRQLDSNHYVMETRWSPGAGLSRVAPQEFVLLETNTIGGAANGLEWIGAFSPSNTIAATSFAKVAAAAASHWHQFWQNGGAIDLSGSSDPRWFELERRIVLSQYLTAIQSAASHPPAETGLTCNSWYGKFHLEMHWWHEAHFALWGRLPLLEKSLGFYDQILPRAQATARSQGYEGARWPKMTSPDGVESPSPVGPFLVWEEPHPIFYAELCHRLQPGQATLRRYQAIVFATADFMASYAAWDQAGHRYVLGPTLQTAQEIFPKNRTLNPTFELSYWRWALATAQAWRIQMGLPPEPHWQDVLDHLAKPSVADGKYLFTETTPQSYTDPIWDRDHPAVLAAMSFIPGQGMDPAIMRASLEWVWQHWNWPTTWGWDYPMMAMTAARLGEPDRAVDALLLDTPKNHYSLNGHVYQRPGLPIYLPANGGLLYAAAFMAAGWDGAPSRHAPGFPDNGRWNVRWEGLSIAP